jgi:hypothetical protein
MKNQIITSTAGQTITVAAQVETEHFNHIASALLRNDGVKKFKQLSALLSINGAVLSLFLLLTAVLVPITGAKAFGQTSAAVNAEAEDDGEVIKVNTDALKVSLTSLPTKADIIWSVTKNGMEEKNFSFINETDKIELTVILEDVTKKRGQKSFFVGQNLKKLARHEAVGKIKIYAVGTSRDDLAVRWDKDWETTFFQSFDEAVDSFWGQPNASNARRAVLVVSNRTESLPVNVFERLRNDSGLQSALVYYLVTNPVKVNNKWVLSWSNLSWQYKWLVTLGEQYIDKQFSCFDEMLGNYRVVSVELDDALRTEVKIVGIEAGTGKKLVEQTRVYERTAEGGLK